MSKAVNPRSELVGEEAVLPGRRQVEQQVDERMPATELGQRAGAATTENAELARLSVYQRLRRRQDIDVAAAGAQQPGSDGRAERLSSRFEGRGHRRELAGVALVEAGERMGTGEGAAGADGAKRREPGASNRSTQWLEVDRPCPGEGLGQLGHLSRIRPSHGRPDSSFRDSRDPKQSYEPDGIDATRGFPPQPTRW